MTFPILVMTPPMSEGFSRVERITSLPVEDSSCALISPTGGELLRGNQRRPEATGNFIGETFIGLDHRGKMVHPVPFDEQIQEIEGRFG